MQNIYILFISDKFIKNTIMENKLSAFIVGIVLFKNTDCFLT